MDATGHAPSTQTLFAVQFQPIIAVALNFSGMVQGMDWNWPVEAWTQIARGLFSVVWPQGIDTRSFVSCGLHGLDLLWYVSWMYIWIGISLRCWSDRASVEASLWSGRLGLSCGVWHQGIGGRFFKSCGLWGGASMDQLFYCLKLLVTFSGPFQSTFCSMTRRFSSWGHCHWGVQLPWWGVLGLQQCLGGWFKVASHECKDPRSYSSELLCNKMINVIHIACQLF